MIDYRKKSFIINGLRRMSYRWPARFRALNRARVGRGEYVCECCGTINKRKEVQLDHITPVVPVEGWDSWEGYLDRMFPDTEKGFQVLCTSCHDDKTAVESEQRKENKKKN